jgi:flagellin
LSVEWKDNTLVVNNKAGGKTLIENFQASADSQILLRINNEDQVDGLYDPILLATSNTTNLPTQPSATFTGVTENTQISLRFSDQLGDYSSAEYSFQITNGEGDIYADFSGSGLNVFNTLSNDEIKSEVLMALSAGIANLSQTDSSFDMSEWSVAVSEDHLLITNKKGRAIAIENFSSSAGFMTATPINEPGGAKVLADKNAYYSETRLQMNTSAFGQDYSAAGTDRFSFTLDGVSNSANLTINVNGSATNGGLTSGEQFASAIQVALQASDISVRDPNNGSAITAADLTSISVRYDADTAELVIRDPAGRAIGFGMDSSANTLCKTGIIFLDDFVTGPPNKMYTVDTSSSTAQGDVYNATAVTIDFGTSDIGFNIQVNGKYLDGESLTSGSALITSNIINWNSEQPFGSSNLKRKLDGLMTTLNSVHPRDVFEYSFFGNSVTIYQRDGGEVILGGYVSSDKHRNLIAEITPSPSQGNATSMLFEAHTISQNATAQGTGSLATDVTLNIEGDDIFSLKISDSITSFTLEPTTVDISNKKSVEAFLQTLEETLSTSQIKVTMDLDGNIGFKRSDGGKIILQEFTSATGRQGSWSPSPGQGNTIALDGNGPVQSANSNHDVKSINYTSSSPTESLLSYIPIEGAEIPLSGISILTQSDSESTLSVIDYALDYVAAERSNLGAIQNRLTHTIDNLTNIVTNTEASQSKILDADYAKETTELTRTQIIQQAATAMLAQANQSAQIVLELLR